MAMGREHEMHRRRRGRNLGVLGILAGLVVLLFVVTIVKLGEAAANPTAGASWGDALMEWILR